LVIEKYSTWKNDKLKKELKSRGCVLTGKKQDFVERLQAYDAAKKSSQIANFVRPYNEQQKRVESAKKISELEDVYQDWKNVVDPNDSLGTDFSFETLLFLTGRDVTLLSSVTSIPS
jgi:hypothetical protein